MPSNRSIGSLPRGTFCSYFTLVSWAAQSWRFYQRSNEWAFVFQHWLEAVSLPSFRRGGPFSAGSSSGFEQSPRSVLSQRPPPPALCGSFQPTQPVHWGHLSGFLTSNTSGNFPTTVMVLSSVGSQKRQQPGFLSVRFDLTAEPTLIPRPDEGKEVQWFMSQSLPAELPQDGNYHHGKLC